MNTSLKAPFLKTLPAGFTHNSKHCDVKPGIAMKPESQNKQNNRTATFSGVQPQKHKGFLSVH